MNDQTDQQLLRDYTERQSEAAFAAIVQRYVDLVYSAAFRMVGDAHAAKDVTQSVFVVLAQNARQLTDRPALAGWLHCTSRNLAAKTVRSDVRRRAREQEAAVMNELLAADRDTSWEHIAPQLDEALGELSEPDRDAVLLRYFKNHDLGTVGATLGISDDAAQKRVSRAVERLRELFAKRGVTVGTSGLAVVISANAVQAAPAGLALTISTAAALTGTTLATTATVTATKAIAMTALQKTIVTATVAVLAGAGIYEAKQVHDARAEVQMLRQQQTPLTERMVQLQGELDEATRQVATLYDEKANLSANTAELLRLRDEVAQLRSNLVRQKESSVQTQRSNSSIQAAAHSWLNRVELLKRRLEQMPELKIPELQFLTDKDWLRAADATRLETNDDVRKALKELRASAKVSFGAMIRSALVGYAVTNNGALPATLPDALPYFTIQIDASLLDRYELVRTGQFDLQKQTTWVIEKAAPVDKVFDTRLEIRSGVVTPLNLPTDPNKN